MEKLTNDIKKIVTDLGYYLYELEYVKEGDGFVLRVMIENESVIDIDDCVKTSRAIGEFLDIDDPFTEAYNLEVTSPGAERELRTEAQIKRAVGKHVYVETYEQQMKGVLFSYKDGYLEIKTKSKQTVKVNEMDINFIRLAIVF